MGDTWTDAAHPCMSFRCSKEGVLTETKVCLDESCPEVETLKIKKLAVFIGFFSKSVFALYIIFSSKVLYPDGSASYHRKALWHVSIYFAVGLM